MKGTLKSRRAFQHIYDHGRRAIGAHVVVFATPDEGLSREEPGAVGIVASRKVGHSPARSRAKRLLRAALREIASRQAPRGHMILVARRALVAEGLRSPELARELERLLARLDCLEESST